jgi:hypothetical protein
MSEEIKKKISELDLRLFAAVEKLRVAEIRDRKITRFYRILVIVLTIVDLILLANYLRHK